MGDGTVLDYEAEKNTYGVEVTATDPSDATAMITVTIAVTDLDEAGTVTLSSDETHGWRRADGDHWQS